MDGLLYNDSRETTQMSEHTDQLCSHWLKLLLDQLLFNRAAKQKSIVRFRVVPIPHF